MTSKMQETPERTVIEKFRNQRNHFSTHQTKDVSFRLNQLRTLKRAISKYQGEIEDALWKDLHKSPEETYLTEISIVNNEIDYHIKNLKKWAKTQRVKTPLYLLPSSSRIMYEPLGVALIVAPWNYPFQLLINPLVGAVSAGCCTVLKPSPDTPSVARVMEEMIAEYFNPEYICLIQGGRDTNTILFEQAFDMMFFTGSPKVGKVVMKAAAKHLSQVVLELGGKSPCIVEPEADLDVAARRIAWGKLINAGQTCIAPDYLFAHNSVKDELLDKIACSFHSMYGENIKQSRIFPRIINDDAMKRLKELLTQGTIHTGGETDAEERFFAPTIIDDVKPDHAVMQGEIFGPILPVMTYEDISEPIEYINQNKKPLAFYYFGKSEKAKQVLHKTTSGGGCINDTLMHTINHHLPFGGVGHSGMGRYHGVDSFLAFSNRRSIVSTTTRIDLPVKYAPFKHFKLLKRMLS